MVAGMDTGYERFNPEWLFNAPGKIEGPVLNPERRKDNVLRANQRAGGLRAEPEVPKRQRWRRIS